MKYKLLGPEDTIQHRDQYVYQTQLANNDAVIWTNVTTSVGSKVKEYQEFSFRRPLPEDKMIVLNDYYTAVVKPGVVVVNNCARAVFTHDIVLKLAELIKEVQGK